MAGRGCKDVWKSGRGREILGRAPCVLSRAVLPMLQKCLCAAGCCCIASASFVQLCHSHPCVPDCHEHAHARKHKSFPHFPLTHTFNYV